MSTKTRNVNIELVRIVACVSVIALHTWKGSGIDEVSTTIKGVIRVFEKHNVPLFFIIMGFFMFSNNKSYLDRIENLITRIIIPSLLAFVFYEIFQDVIEARGELVSVCEDIVTRLANIPKYILSTNPGYNSTLWFVYEYIRIVLFYPFIALLCQDEKRFTTIRRVIMVICFLNIAISNVLHFVNGITDSDIVITNWSPINIYVLYVYIGYELRNKISEYDDNRFKTIISGLFIYCISNFVICFEEFISIKTGIGDSYYYENSALHIISTVALFIAIMNIPLKNDSTNRIIKWIAKRTFGIYLVHYFYVRLTETYGIFGWIKLSGLVKYCFVVLLIFIISLITSLIFGCVGKICSGILSEFVSCEVRQ